MVGCQSGSNNVRVIDPLLEPYVDRFESLTQHQYPVDIKVDIKDLPPNEDGICAISSNGFKEISISPIYIQHEQFTIDSTGYSKGLEQLVWHEIGHCILYRQHTTALRDGVHPSSVMYPYTFGYTGSNFVQYFTDNEVYYLDELVQNYGH